MEFQLLYQYSQTAMGNENAVFRTTMGAGRKFMVNTKTILWINSAFMRSRLDICKRLEH